MEEFVTPEMQAEADRAWAHNRLAVQEWLDQQQELVRDMVGHEPNAPETLGALNSIISTYLLVDPTAIVKIAALTASALTMLIFGSGSAVPDDQLPPMVTTDDN